MNPLKPNDNTFIFDGIDATCECGNFFRVPKSMKGGMSNCPRCGKAVEIQGGPEPLFYILLALGGILVAGISALMFAVSTTAGLVTLGIGIVILVLVVIAL